jgi:hypothetical protein
MTFIERRTEITPNKNTLGNYLTSTSGSDGKNFSNLFWGKTNQPNYYCAFCYIKNLGDKELKLSYSIQGHIRLKDSNDNLTNNYTWRTIHNDVEQMRTSRKIIIPSGETRLLEFCVFDHSDNHQMKAEIYDDYSYTRIDFFKLFWRINVLNLSEETKFEILDEKTNDNQHLVDKFGSVNFISRPYDIEVQIGGRK